MFQAEIKTFHSALYIYMYRHHFKELRCSFWGIWFVDFSSDLRITVNKNAQRNWILFWAAILVATYLKKKTGFLV